ncbi:MAG: hypothetical protein P0S95_00495 [Rhabdochlamydiaceae bacterium]|nr:hypothetical protein [Candidatus Amphrikana amoebophyrae]
MRIEHVASSNVSIYEDKQGVFCVDVRPSNYGITFDPKTHFASFDHCKGQCVAFKMHIKSQLPKDSKKLVRLIHSSIHSADKADIFTFGMTTRGSFMEQGRKGFYSVHYDKKSLYSEIFKLAGRVKVTEFSRY